MQRHDHDPHDPADRFPTDPSGLPEAGRPQVLELADGDTLGLRVAPVAKRLGGTTVRMLAYNGSIPGPTLKVRQGSEIIVRVENPAIGWRFTVGDRVKLRLFDVSNPGLWIAHCHLAEHLQSGMMFSFNVAHTG
jgi:FtsP/CotA-like multicopper oxidase with cupredoxin domain